MTDEEMENEIAELKKKLLDATATEKILRQDISNLEARNLELKKQLDARAFDGTGYMD